jgi:hypothetical protein
MHPVLRFIYAAVSLFLAAWGVYLGLYPREAQASSVSPLAIIMISLALVMVIVYLVPHIYHAIWGPPVEFFPNRSVLQKAHGTIAERLRSIRHTDALWVLGQKFYHAGDDTHKVRRLLLPNPRSENFKFFTSTGPNWSAENTLKEITELAKKAGAEVRWYDHFISHSIILADTDKWRGWVHIESVFPYSTTDQRPSYTIYRRGQRKAVEEMQRVFNVLWERSTPK